MYYLISVLILIASILLILIILVQNSKGGGLAANFSGSSQMMGVRKTADFLEKTTWTLALIILGLTLLAGITIPRAGNIEEIKKSRIEEKINNTVDPTSAPNFPTAPIEETTE